MPQQLIYTSAPRGIVAGRSGHCTVARSATMRDALMLRLEQLSYYQHLSLSGGKERPICAYRIVDIRGSRFHILSRIQDAGLDFTGRTNFVAHHLALTSDEFRQFPTPPIILRDWPEWVKSWTQEPILLENEDWSALVSLGGKSSVPALTWQRVTGDAVNGYGLLDARSGATFRVDDQRNETVLGLFAESIELLEVRDARRDFRAAGLPYTFTTSMQEQDNPADFRWRCIQSDNPAANRFATPDCRALSAVRATKWTGEETAFARDGRQAPRFVVEPQDVQITEGGTARFEAKAVGVPNPTYQWFSVDRNDNGQPLPSETNPELTLSNPTLGKTRYVVQAASSAGDAMSRIASLAVDQKLRTAPSSLGHQARSFVSVPQKSESEIERQRNRLESEEAEKLFLRKRRLKRQLAIFSLTFAAVLIAIACVILTKPTWGSHFKEYVAAKWAVLRGSTNNTLPPGWVNRPIGDVDVAHTAFTDGQFSLLVKADGLGLNGDNFLFVCYTNAGKQFEATLGTNLPSEPGGAGIMVRHSLATNAPFLFVGASSNEVFVCERTNAIWTTNRIGERQQGIPITLKLSFNRGTFTATYLGAIIAHFTSEEHALVGLAVWSGKPTNPAVALFTKVSPPDIDQTPK